MHGVVCLVLTVLAVWPVRPLESVLNGILWTTRPILGLASPLGWMGQVRAADGELEELWGQEARESAALEGLIQEQAVPHSAPLEGGALLHAEAVGRPEGELDRLLVRVWRPGIVRVGMPVTSGDHYVGLVRGVLSRSGVEGSFDDVTVELITSSQARVGAGVFAGEDWERDSRFVVGGLLAPEDFGLGQEQVILAVHHPTRQGLQGSRVLVREQGGGGRDLAYLVNGFELGVLDVAQEPDERTRMELIGVRPGVDFESGLYQVMIHTGMRPEDIVEDPEAGAMGLGEWIPVDRVPMVDAAPWREGFKLTAGSRSGLQQGAAVACGVRLVGRVLRRGLWHGDVQGLGDRGFFGARHRPHARGGRGAADLCDGASDRPGPGPGGSACVALAGCADPAGGREWACGFVYGIRGSRGSPGVVDRRGGGAGGNGSPQVGDRNTGRERGVGANPLLSVRGAAVARWVLFSRG